MKNKFSLKECKCLHCQEKLDLIRFMWRMAYADNKLDVDEERLIRRMADLINIKDIDILKLKDLFRT